MSTYDDVIAKFPAGKRKEIKTLLERWATGSGLGRKVTANLQADNFIPVASMHAILEALLAVSRKPIAEVEAAYVAECHKHSLKGGNVQANREYPFPNLVGRAVDRERFVAALLKIHGPNRKNPAMQYFTTRRQVNDFVDRLLLKPAASPTERNLFMSEYACWVTWTEKTRRHPFSSLGRRFTADDVRASLGLDPQSSGDVLLLCFNRAALPQLCRPTIADAGLSEYFRPAPNDFTLHGWTDPWPKAFARTRKPTKVRGRPIPRPEAVHSRTTFGCLRTPVRQLS